MTCRNPPSTAAACERLGEATRPGLRQAGGFTRLEDVTARDELAAIADGYAKMAGFAVPR